VGNNPDPVSPVGSADGCSWNNKRLYGVTFSFQFSAHLFEYHAPVPSSKPENVFAHDVARSDLSNSS
jgi:hypothetical protein